MVLPIDILMDYITYQGVHGTFTILVVGVNNERISLLTEIDEQKIHTKEP